MEDENKPEKKPKKQRLVLDLERNKELDRVASDCQVGDELEATLEVIAYEPGKTLTVELSEVVCEGDAADTEEDDAEDGEKDSGDETPAMRIARGG